MSHEIMLRYRTDRTLSTIFWLLMAFIITRIYWSGELANFIATIVRSFRGAEHSNEMGAWSFVLVSIVADVAYAIGMAVLFVVADVQKSFELWRQSRFPGSAAPGEPGHGDPQPQAEVTVAQVLENLQNGLVALQAQVDDLKAASTPVRTTRSRGGTR